MKNLLYFALILAFCACQNDNSTESKKATVKTGVKAGFEIVTSEKSNINFINSLKDDPKSDKNVLSFNHYFNGAGVGVADFNNDGLQDIFFAGNEVKNALYINKGDLQFEKLEDSAGININKVWAAGVSIVDINNDGFKDIYVCQQGPYTKDKRKNLFYINNGDLTFTESAQDMGLDDDNYSTQAAFFDFDKDGDLDCYVMNESKYAGIILKDVYNDIKDENKLREASGKLFRNDGNLKFTDITKESGVLNYGYGLGLCISDLNGDNWPDIYVANDYTVPDFMYINQKDGTFKESIKSFTKQISYFGMGCDIADINNDGLVDIGVVDMAAEDHFRDKTLMAGMDVEAFKYYFYNRGYQLQYMFNSLQLNNGNNTFSNIAAMAGILRSDWSWSAVFSDFNFDGNKDLYVSNGFRRYARDNDFRNKMKEVRDQNNGTIPLDMREELYELMPEIKLQNKLYINDGKLHFSDHSNEFTHPEYDTYSYGIALADFDNDGDIDLIANNIDQKAMLLKNNTVEKTDNNWLKIKLDESQEAKKIGAKISIHYSDKVQLQEYQFIRGYESTMEEALFFGVGQVNKIDTVSIIWPDNNVQILNNIKINQVLNIKYEKGQNFSNQSNNNSVFAHVTGKNNPIPFTHKENDFDDFEKEILLPQKQSAFGPALASGDINNDGLDDIYIGGAKGQSGALYIQKENGDFELYKSQPWSNDRAYEDVDALFLDVNNDGFQDLFVLSGGSGDFVGQPDLLLDRFYANDGKGNFFRIGNVLPSDKTASYKIIEGNIDADPDKELFILGAAKPGQYPITEKSMILDYVDNKYVDITESVAPQIASNNTLLRDAIFMDINNDKLDDLITVGEWDKIKLYSNENGKLNLNTNHKFGDKNGWWKTIKHADLDNDGDIDFIVGNVGKNIKQKATKETPLHIYSNDFDNNGTLDCVLAKPYNGKIVPARGKECSTEQMPFVSEKFKTYADFASASVIDIYGEDKLESGIALQADDFYSYVIWNNDGNFEMEKLPSLAQSFPINAIEFMDYDGDKFLDIIIAGNDYNTEYETPRLDAGYGLILKNINGKSFESLGCIESGIYSPGDVKTSELINSDNGQILILANNNGPLDIYKLK